ncbi:MAG: hypothetical protein JW944_12565, partial [Deltaproteobacteria bacterium]|nr:hypothetical protein [Deltaproteobacteria bacterium]
KENFEKSSIIYGDINDFIERTWGRERYESAMAAYEGSVIIHDVARKNSIVHTDYEDIVHAPFENIIFTHSPDNLTSIRPILSSGKRIVLSGGRLFESVRGEPFPFDADVYIRHFTCNFVGYASEKGSYKIIEKDGLLGPVDVDTPGDGLMRVDLYQDIRGEYFPALTRHDQYYRIRPDSRVELVTSDAELSSGRIVENMRPKLMKSK